MKETHLNAGEWGELYAFLRLTADGRVQVSDEKEKEIDGAYLDITGVSRHESRDRVVTYEANETPSGAKSIIVRVNGTKTNDVPAEEFINNANEIFKLVKEGRNSPSTHEEEIIGFLTEVQAEHRKAKSQDKSDIFLDITDTRGGLVRKEIGYSIKSKWSKKSTLFNTGSGSGTRYALRGDMDEETIKRINSITDSRGNADVIGRVKAIFDSGCELSFVGYVTPPRAGCQAFVENCELINPLLPKVWQEVVYAHFSKELFSGATTSMKNICEWLIKTNPCNITRPEVKYPYMLKAFLYASYCGLTASTLWDGKSDVNGGLITVDADGNLLAFNALDGEAFKSYLFEHCSIDYPSTAPNHGDYGHIYRDGNQLMMNFNFQIRFSSY